LESFRELCEKLKYSPLEQVSPNFKNLHVTNATIKSDIVPIIIKVPALRIRNVFQVNQKCKQSVPVRLSIYTGLPENNKLLTFLTRIENEIFRKVKLITLNKTLQLSSCITKYKEYYPDFKINAPFVRINNCVEFLFDVYGKKNHRVNFASITKGAKMMTYIELNHVWIGDTKMSLHWTIKRAVVYPERIWTLNAFNDSDEYDSEEEIVTEKECYHCMYCPNNHVRTHCCLGNNINQNQSYQSYQSYQTQIPNYSLSSPSLSLSTPQAMPLPPPPPPPHLQINKNINVVEEKQKFVPSLNDLLNSKSKLKSISTNNDKKNNEDNSTNINNLQNIKNNLKNKD